MAKVLGESGRYVSEQAVIKRKRILIIGFIVIGLIGVFEGWVLATLLPLGIIKNSFVKLFIAALALLGAILVSRWGFKRVELLDRERLAVTRGATGEMIVGSKLADFPEEFCVINDLTTPYGNLDHVVIGPTGVFILDAKNWRGMVSADGKGELLLNNTPTEKPLVRQFVGRMLGIREKVRTLATGLDPFYQAVFVFTAARVQAKWGTTGGVHCITDDQLQTYIVEKDFGKRLQPDEVQRLAQAFLALAHMDREFRKTENPQPALPLA
jgi:hypothetical protein